MGSVATHTVANRNSKSSSIDTKNALNDTFASPCSSVQFPAGFHVKSALQLDACALEGSHAGCILSKTQQTRWANRLPTYHPMTLAI